MYIYKLPVTNNRNVHLSTNDQPIIEMYIYQRPMTNQQNVHLLTSDNQ